MNSITDYYNYAELSFASYADLHPGIPDTDLLTTDDIDMSQSQAEQFADTWVVIDQYDGTTEESYIDEFGQEHYYINHSGLSVTLFQNSETGEQVVSVRGTNDINDVITDVIDIGALGTTEYQTQYKLLSEKVQLWMDNNLLQSGFTATGHSLGGYLATNLALEYYSDVAHTYAYNAPGLNGVIGGDVFTSLYNAFLPGIPLNIPHNPDITNIVAVGDVVSLVGSYASTPITVLVEPTNFLSAHSIAHMTDALAVYNLLASLDSSLTISDVHPIFEAASNEPETSLENIVNAVGDIFNVGSKVGDENRDELYTRIQAIEGYAEAKELLGKLKVVQTSSLAFSSQQNTDLGLAYRYALVHLNPFAITGDASIYNQNHELDLYDTETGAGALTAQYLKDRAQMLNWLIKYNETDTAYSEKLDSEQVGDFVGNYHYTDYSMVDDFGNPTRLTIDGEGFTVPYNQVKFGGAADETIVGVDNPDGVGNYDHLYGGAGNDTIQGKGGDDYLEGNSGDDHLYGGDDNDTMLGGTGNDTLEGGKGNDRLEGGVGNDTYIYTSGDGLDTILDTDGLGSIKFDGTTLNGGKKIGDGIYQSNDGKYTYTFEPDVSGIGTLIINRCIRVESFKDGDLGITLQSPALEAPEQTGAEVVVGAGAGIDRTRDGTVTGSWYNYDAALYLANDVANEEELDYPWIDENDHSKGTLPFRFEGAGDNDFLKGSTHPETSKPVNDWLDGGDGDDLLYGDADPSSANGDADLLIGGRGNDQLYGGAGNDYLVGWNHQLIPYSGSVATVPALGADCEGSNDWDYLNGGSGDDTLVAGRGDDILVGGAGNDVILGNLGADIISGGANNDYIMADAYAKTFEAPSESGRYIYVAGDLHVDYSQSADNDDIVSAGDGNDIAHGGAGADTIYGGNGNDVIHGDQSNHVMMSRINIDGTAEPEANLTERYVDLDIQYHGDDMLIGGTGDDLIFGNGGNDNIYGGANNDAMFGDDIFLTSDQHGDDYMSGDDGADRMFGGGGSDTMYGGSGNDQLYGDNGPRQIIGYAGITPIYGSPKYQMDWGEVITYEVAVADQKQDFLYGEAGNDILNGDGGDDYLDGGADGDNISGGSGVDTIIGGTGNDTLRGDAGDDIYNFSTGDGTDYVTDSTIGKISITGAITDYQQTATTSTICYGAGDKIILQDSSISGVKEILVNGEKINIFDYLNSDNSAPINGTAGADTIDLANIGNTTSVNAAAGDDSIISSQSGTYTIEGGAGDDQYIVDAVGQHLNLAFSGNDVGTDNIQIQGDLTSGQLYASKDGNSLKLYITTDPEGVLDFDTATQITLTNYFVTLPEFGAINFSNGESIALNDLVQNIKLLGDDGDNYIYGTSGDDVILGQKGNDHIYGGRGDDTYVYRAGDGHDIINNYDSDAGHNDQIAFDASIDPADIIVRREEDDLVLYWQGDKIITVSDHFISDSYAISAITFIDGTVYDQATIDSMVLEPSVIDDVLYGGDGADVMAGLAGNDSLYGMAGDDTLHGDAGDDDLYGGEGSDTYEYNLGDGHDQIHNADSDGAVDRIKLGADITPDRVVFDRDGYDLNLLVDQTLCLTVVDHFKDGDNAIDYIEFQDGTTWSKDAITTALFTVTEGDDVLHADDLDNVINGLGGNDRIFAYKGDDALTGGAGNDILNGGMGNDTYYFSRGDGIDTVVDRESNVSSDGSFLGEELDTLVFDSSVSPDDILVRRVANPDNSDGYIYHNLVLTNKVSGDQVILDKVYDYDSWERAMDYTKIIITHHLGVTTQSNKQVQFADGTLWTMDDLHALAIIPTEDDDQLYGVRSYYGDDTIYGLGGDDLIDGFGGDDTLVGGLGDDTLIGHIGYDDTYIYYRGDGFDVIQEDQGTGIYQDNDTLQLPDLTPDDVWVYFNSDGILTLSLRDGSGGVVFGIAPEDQLDDSFAAKSTIETIQFADGAQWNMADIEAAIVEAPSLNQAPIVNASLADQTTAEDSLFSLQIPEGTFTDPNPGDTLTLSAELADGSALPDWLNFDAATNTLSGTPDNSQVGSLDIRITATDNLGESVSDTFTLDVANVNDAPELVTPLVDVDAAEGESFSYVIPDGTFRDIDAGDVITYTATLADGSDLPGWLSIDSTSGTLSGELPLDAAGDYDIIIQATDQSGASVSDSFHLAIANLVQTGPLGGFGFGTSMDDLIIGSSRSDRLFGYDGDDEVIAGGGNDMLWGGNGNDTLVGGDGMDVLFGGAGNDHLQGGAENDSIEGGAGDDILDGGAGNDMLVGGSGDDIYLFSRSGGQDMINNFAFWSDDVDTLSFTDVAYDDLSFNRIWTDLVIDVAGTDDQVTVKNWFRGEAYQLDTIETSDMVLQNDQVNQLVNAMAVFNVIPGTGFITANKTGDYMETLLGSSSSMLSSQ